MIIERARNVIFPKEVVLKKYNGFQVDDAVKANYKDDIILGIGGINKNVPILDYLLKNEVFKSFIDGYKNKVIYIDLDYLYDGNNKVVLPKEIKMVNTLSI